MLVRVRLPLGALIKPCGVKVNRINNMTTFYISHVAAVVATFISDRPITKRMIRKAATYLRQQGITYCSIECKEREIIFYGKEEEVFVRGE